MKKNYYALNENHFLKSQILGSLVINTPDKVDFFTTSPKIPKLISLPFGLRIPYTLLFNNLYQLITSMIILMSTSSMFIFFLYLPLENKNDNLLNCVKDLTNKKYLLLENVEEASSYNKLFTYDEKFSLKDTKNIIYIQKTNLKNTSRNESSKVLNNYPEFHFTGF